MCGIIHRNEKALGQIQNESLIITSIEMDQTNMVLEINRQSRVVNAGMKGIYMMVLVPFHGFN